MDLVAAVPADQPIDIETRRTRACADGAYRLNFRPAPKRKCGRDPASR